MRYHSEQVTVIYNIPETSKDCNKTQCSSNCYFMKFEGRCPGDDGLIKYTE